MYFNRLPTARHVREPSHLRRACQIREASWSRGHQHGAFGRAAGFADGRRFPARLRGECVAAPKNTPPKVVDRLNKAILADPKSKARFTEIGAFLLPGSANDFGKLVADETEK